MIKLADILNEIEKTPLDRLRDELRIVATSWDKSGRKSVAKLIQANIANATDIADAVKYLETLKYTAKEYTKALYVAGLLKKYKQQPEPLAEAKKEEPKIGAFEDFAETRGKGADKIAKTAKEKGGLALLTYNHFKVKALYYKKAAEGKFDIEEAKKEYESVYKSISLTMTQTEFQKAVGKLEVLGELIIRDK